MNRPERDRQFMTFTRGLLSVPTWADYEAADEPGKSEIVRAWKNNWRNDEAFRLLRRAVAIERAKHEQAMEAARRERIANMPTPLGPLGGYRNPRELDNAEVDSPRALATGETWEAIYKQSNCK